MNSKHIIILNTKLKQFNSSRTIVLSWITRTNLFNKVIYINYKTASQSLIERLVTFILSEVKYIVNKSNGFLDVAIE
jgi:hypothetical protein